MRVEIVRDPIDAGTLLPALRHPACGAVTTFSGTVRNHSRGRTVTALDYTAYEDMARAQMEAIATEARQRFELTEIILVHRLGTLTPGETSVFIGVASAHRAAAFEACRFIIDSLKERVPIWKKEHYHDGENWIEGDTVR